MQQKNTLEIDIDLPAAKNKRKRTVSENYKTTRGSKEALIENQIEIQKSCFDQLNSKLGKLISIEAETLEYTKKLCEIKEKKLYLKNQEFEHTRKNDLEKLKLKVQKMELKKLELELKTKKYGF